MLKRNKRKSKPKKKNLGRYASGIEKYCAEQLKNHGIAFDYEEHKFELMDSFRFPHTYLKMTAKGKVMSDRTGKMQHSITYKPDFMGKDGKWVIETKGYLPSHHDFPMRWKLFLRHIVENDLGYAVFLAKNQGQVDQAIQEILKIQRDDR
jgi:hypothetical protein|tara:strand:+ start:6161 stop:6610 length:450 start_codon:yes stop_codon:yes gene_type:complete